MDKDVDGVAVRAALDLAIAQLFEDAQSLEAAGLEVESGDAYACAQILKSMRNKVIRACRG